MWLGSPHQGLLFLCACTSLGFTPATTEKLAHGRSSFAELTICHRVPCASLLPDIFWYNINACDRRYATQGFVTSVINNPASTPLRLACDISSALFSLWKNRILLSPRLLAHQRFPYNTNGDLPLNRLYWIKTNRCTAAASDELRSPGGAAFFKSLSARQASRASAVEVRSSVSAGKEDEPRCIPGSAKVISITAKARDRLYELRARQNTSGERRGKETGLFLRLGVQSGGCSGLSYVLDIIDKAAVTSTDFKEEFKDEKEGSTDFITVVVDPKSLLYVVGTVLDYSDDLIGGGFKVSNPNATRSCGCGMSFGVPKTFAQHLIDSKPTSCSSPKKADKSASAPRRNDG